MLLGLGEGEVKMSKSTGTAIFMEDSEQDIKKKVSQAFCPPQVIEKNPVLDYLKHMVFEAYKTFEVQRKPENGGNK